MEDLIGAKIISGKKILENFWQTEGDIHNKLMCDIKYLDVLGSQPNVGTLIYTAACTVEGHVLHYC